MLPSPIDVQLLLLLEAADEKCTVKCCGADLIGHRVKIWWPQEKTFVRGEIKYFNRDEGLHMINYDLGVKEVLDLLEECWHLEQETDSGPGASNTMVKNAGISSTGNSKRKHVEAACQEVMTQKDKKEEVTRKESNSHEDQAIYQKAAAAAVDSKIECISSSEHQKKQKTLACPLVSSVEDENVDGCCELVDVGGYLVKASIAPTLRSIFSKYGDITSNCLLKHHSMRSFLLEVVCNVVNKLQNAEFGACKFEVKDMISKISDAAEAKLDVSWLQKFLEKINQIEEVDKNYSELIELRAKSNLIVKAARKDMEAAKKQFIEAKGRWEALEHVKAKIENDVVNFLAPKQVWRMMVDELL